MPNALPPSGTVLVIEDNPDGRDTLQDLLELWGYAVSTAPDGPEGIRRLKEEQPTTALVDIGLPGLDGYEVARRIRASEDGYRPRLIAMSGYGQPEDQRLALEAGFDAYLVKPVNPQALAGLLGVSAGAEE